jgi:hypothetical protein
MVFKSPGATTGTRRTLKYSRRDSMNAIRVISRVRFRSRKSRIQRWISETNWDKFSKST